MCVDSKSGGNLPPRPFPCACRIVLCFFSMEDEMLGDKPDTGYHCPISVRSNDPIRTINDTKE